MSREEQLAQFEKAVLRLCCLKALNIADMQSHVEEAFAPGEEATLKSTFQDIRDWERLHDMRFPMAPLDISKQKVLEPDQTQN